MRSSRAGGCAIDPSHLQHDAADGAWLFVEDDGAVHRFRLGSERVRIGRDQANDIWIDHPAVRAHTVLIYEKDGEHCIKVYEGAKVTLNGVPVAGMHRLYGGDRLGIADREFLYGRDDTPAEVAVGLTVLVDGEVQHAVAYRRTRIRIGRRDADVLLADPSVADRHLVVECYGVDGVFVCDLGSATGTYVRGQRVSERVRVGDGALVQIGRVGLRVHILPADAHGLLLAAPLPAQPKVPLAAPKPMDRSPAQRHDPAAAAMRQRQADARPVSGGFIRPLHQANARSTSDVARRPEPPPPDPVAPPEAALVPATEIGSLQQILREQQAQALAQTAAAVARQAEPHRADAPPVRQRQSHAADRPAVRIKPEVLDAVTDRPRSPRPPQGARFPQHDEPEVRVRPRELAGEMVPVSPLADHGADLGPGREPSGFHQQFTEMLDTGAVRERTRGRPSWLDGPDPQAEARALFGQPPGQGAPLTQVLDTVGSPLPPTGGGRPGSERSGSERSGSGLVRIRRDVPVEPARSERSRVLDRPLSEAERAANPGLGRESRVASGPPSLPAHADRSQRHVREQAIDRSRRGFADSRTQHDPQDDE